MGVVENQTSWETLGGRRHGNCTLSELSQPCTKPTSSSCNTAAEVMCKVMSWSSNLLSE